MIAGRGRQDLGDASEPPLRHGQGLAQCGRQSLLHGSLAGSCMEQEIDQLSLGVFLVIPNQTFLGDSSMEIEKNNYKLQFQYGDW